MIPFSLFGLGSFTLVRADVTLPAMISEHAVLQRDAKVAIWGKADAGEAVTVEFRAQKKTATADKSGAWSVTLDPLTAGGPDVLTITGKNTVTVPDLLVGEVWICSGQSNMERPVQSSLDSDLEALSANDSQIRLMQVPHSARSEPFRDAALKWTPCSPESVANFSAIGYYYGKQLRASLNVPVGLIECAWGGTRAEAWARTESLQGDEVLRPIVDQWTQKCHNFDVKKAEDEYLQRVKEWDELAEKAKAENKPIPPKPTKAEDPRFDKHHPGNLFNGMVSPLAPYSFRGVIWHQGESNTARAYQYRRLLPVLIKDWRGLWKVGDFPFYIVQLANHHEIQAAPRDSEWAELREAQWLTARALPKVEVICSTDLGAAKEMLPKDKQTVGRRLARVALNDLYGMPGKIVRCGPQFKSSKLVGEKFVIEFEHPYNGPLNSLTSWYNEPLRGFAIAGKDREWKWATVKIVGDTIEVWHPEVPEPAAVRYNWADNPQGNLYNGAYLPAYPFRTDDWDAVTRENTIP